MNFELTADQEALREGFARFLDEESSMARVRAALPTGFDMVLWSGLAELGAFCVRVPEAAGGLGLGLIEATALLEEAGRTLASGPLAEAMVAARLLAEGASGADLLNSAMAGEKVVVLALHDIAQFPAQWIEGGLVADALVGRHGDDLVVVDLAGVARPEFTSRDLGGTPLWSGASLGFTPAARLDLGNAPRTVLASGPQAIAAFAAGVEEWKLLTAAAASGIGRQAIQLASAYACERKQFGQHIGAYQGLSHPLADLITEVEAGKLLIWLALRKIADGAPDAAADISAALWWNGDVAARAGQQGLQTFGGYGLTTEYDIYLFNLRAKAAGLAWGDPQRLMVEAGERRYSGVSVPLPDVGEVPIEFDLGDKARAYADEVDAFFRANLTPELKAKAHYSWEGHDDGMQKKLAEAGLLFPGWPVADGGRGLGPYELTAGSAVWTDHGWSGYSTGTTSMIGTVIRMFGSDELKAEVLTKIARGEVICSLGFSEPGSGSDAFAAQCKATPDGNGWRIDGTKMFTSGANLASYVLMLARTDPDAPKHKGLTMFIVPLKADGVTVQPVYTFMDERTNITFYDGVTIPDSWRLGEVNGGSRVMASALSSEHGASFHRDIESMVHAAEELAREIPSGTGRLIDDPAARARLANARTVAQAARMLGTRAMWAGVAGKAHAAFGPMAKLFSSERFLATGHDLINLTAPWSLLRDDATHAGEINLGYRHAHGTRIYAGTSQVHRSMIAEKFLGLPRSRAVG